MGFHRAGGELAALHQRAGQRLQALQLLFRRSLLIEIPDQADAEGRLILRRTMEMAAVELFLPAISHPDRAVGHAVAIADEEMVGEAVLHVALLAMIPIQRLQRPLVHRGVMDDDVTPASGFHRSGGNALLNGGRQLGGGARRRFGWSRGWDREPLANVKLLISSEAVPAG